MPRGVAMCYYEGCPNHGKYQCRAILCCKDYGCGRVVCKDHKNTKCIKQEGRCGASQNTCKECEPRAHKCTLIMIIWPIVLILCIAIFHIVRVFAFKNDEECADDDYECIERQKD